jgi:DnaK suppressor protein
MQITAIERYRAVLEAKAAELSQRVSDRRLIEIEHTPEDCERMVLAAQREIAIAAMDHESRLSSEIEAALARIEGGSYGFCLHCEQQIKSRRLDALPWARFCVECQEKLDKEQQFRAAGHSASFGVAA